MKTDKKTKKDEPILLFTDTFNLKMYRSRVEQLKIYHKSFVDELNRITNKFNSEADIINAINDPERFIENHIRSLIPDIEPLSKLPTDKDAVYKSIKKPDLSKLITLADFVLNLSSVTLTPLDMVYNDEHYQIMEKGYNVYAVTHNQIAIASKLKEVVDGLIEVNRMYQQLSGSIHLLRPENIIRTENGTYRIQLDFMEEIGNNLSSDKHPKL